MPTTYSDGTVNHGDIAVTMSSAGAVIIEGFTITRSSTALVLRDQVGVVSRQKFIASQPDTATGTIQVPSAGTRTTLFETFTYNTETWIVTSVGETHTWQDYDKQSATFTRKYN